MASTIRPRVFLDVQSGSDFFGRITIELFHDKAPKTCENFVALCTSSFTPPSATKPLTYKLSPFHRVIDEFMIQGGDITAGDGTGGVSIYGGNFEDENIGWREIDKEGLICMANRGKNTNSSQFFITLAPCPHLNTKHTVFGHVVSGREVLDRIAKVRVDAKDRPVSEILVSRCGELERRIKNTVPVKVAPSSNHPLDHRRPSPDNRGRQRPKLTRTTASSSDSRSGSSASSSYRRNGRKHENSTRPRRRSDFTIDETRRGRSLTRSASPEQPSKPPISRHNYHHHHHHRKRSPPPSRSRSPKMNSQSPHLRRRHTRSRSRSRSPRTRGWRNDRRENGAHRWWDEEILRREEEEREGGRQRWEGIIDDGTGYDDRAYGGMRHGNYEVRDANKRLGGGEIFGAEVGTGAGGKEVRFKGRGNMKYKERKW